MKVHLMHVKSAVVISIYFLFSSALMAQEITLVNGTFNMSDNAMYPTGWSGAKDGVQVNLVTEGLPEGVSQAVQFVPVSEQKYMGYVLQKITLPAEKAKQYIVSGYLRAQPPMRAILEVKLFAAGKELSRVDSPNATDTWAMQQVAFTPGDADSIQVLCRWTADVKSLGKAAAFANLTLQTAGKCLAIVGDSTVQDYSASDNRRGWGQMLKSAFGQGIAVTNHAAGGRSTKTFIAEKRWQAVLDSKPDFVLIQFGHNDSHAKDRPESTDADGDYRDYLIRYVKEARAIDCVPILVTPPHRRLYKEGKVTSELAPYANQVHLVSSELNVPLIDLYTMTGELYESLGEDAATALFCSDKDRTHFSEKGASTLAQMITDTLPKICPELASQLRK